MATDRGQLVRASALYGGERGCERRVAAIRGSSVVGRAVCGRRGGAAPGAGAAGYARWGCLQVGLVREPANPDRRAHRAATRCEAGLTRARPGSIPGLPR